MRIELKLLSVCIVLYFFGIASAAKSGIDLLPGRDVCGIQEENRIYGGEEVALGEFPWMALLGIRIGFLESRTIFLCGGSLINNRYVLTAAHCLKDNIYNVTVVRLGEHDIASKEDCVGGVVPGLEYCSDPPLDVEIEEKIIHENYNPENISTLADIALLRLKQEVAYTDFIKPICLPLSPELQNKTYAGTNAMVSGWGATRNATESDIKLKVEVPVVSTEQCARPFRFIGMPITDKQICAGGVKGENFCRGDSGGPLMHLDRTLIEENWINIGVVSVTFKFCATARVPGVYTRTTEYIPWILEHLKP